MFACGTTVQTAPPAAITPMWSAQQALVGPSGIVATTLFVAGSMRLTLGMSGVARPSLATHTARGVTAIPNGFLPTWIVLLTRYVFEVHPIDRVRVRIRQPDRPVPDGEVCVRIDWYLLRDGVRLGIDSQEPGDAGVEAPDRPLADCEAAHSRWPRGHADRGGDPGTAREGALPRNLKERFRHRGRGDGERRRPSS